MADDRRRPEQAPLAQARLEQSPLAQAPPEQAPPEQAPPEQAPLTADNDLSKTEATRAVVGAMVEALNEHDIDGMDRFFAPGFRWVGNAGCGVKVGLRAFQDNWQRPFQAAFSGKRAIDEARLAEGEWMAAFGAQYARHTGTFMGIPPTGREVVIRYMDFWRVRDGKIVDNRVMVDFPDVMRQLGVDPFNGHGWEGYDDGSMTPPRPGVADPGAADPGGPEPGGPEPVGPDQGKR